MGPFDGNVEEGGRGTHRLPKTDHRETSAADMRRVVGYTQGEISAGSVGKAVGHDLYRDMEGNRGTVDGVNTNIHSVCMGEGLRGG